MNNKIWSKIFIFICLFSYLWSPSPSQALYKKKVQVGQFQNPENWNKPYHPGNIIAELLTQELIRQKRVQLISISGNIRGPMEGDDRSFDKYNNVEPAIFNYGEMGFPETLAIQSPGAEMRTQATDRPWPTGMGRVTQKASLTKIRGTVLEFIPDMKSEKLSDSMPPKKRENAQLQVHVELIQNKTGRVLFEKTFMSLSSAGSKPFSMKMSGLKNEESEKTSSMNYALDNLKQKISLFVAEKLDSFMLEGEIIATNKKQIVPDKGEKPKFEEEILINLGSANGVHIGDVFKVHAVSLALQDPFTGSDLGDIYVRTGVIQILHTWAGFSKAGSLGGANYKTGFLVRSVTASGEGIFSESVTKKEEVPWWDFHGIRPVNQ